MNKKIIKRKIRQDITYDLEGTIDEAIQWLTKVKEIHPKAYLEADYIEDERGTLTIYVSEEETDSEYKERLDREARRQAQEEARERRVLKELKEKYGE